MFEGKVTVTLVSGLLLAAALGGCTDDESRIATGEPEALTTANRITANRITANRITANRITANMLAAGELLSTADGRDLFTYIVSCAIPDGETLEATVDGTTYEFPGSIGLAPAWEDRALSEREKRWVSACLIARVNAYGISVPISIRGDHEALAVSADEVASFGLEEGAFYGNVFVPEDQPIEWVACRGEAQAAGETGGLVNRDCTEPDADGLTKCGFTFAGDCVRYSTSTSDAHACKRREDGHYQDCHTVAGDRRWPSGTERKEVITVFVQGS